MSFIQENFSKKSQDNGVWILKYGEIQDEVSFENENYVNSDKSVGYCKIKTIKGPVFHAFFSKAHGKEYFTLTGIENAVVERDNIVLNFLKPVEDLKSYYDNHMQLIKNKADIDKSYMESQLKGNTVPRKLYELVSRVAAEKIKSPQSLTGEKFDEKLNEYKSFLDQNFKKIGKGKGVWEFHYGPSTEKIKFKYENYLNENGDIGYCKIKRKDDFLFHVFISRLGKKTLVTTSGISDMQVDIDSTRMNVIKLENSLEVFFKSHVHNFFNISPDKEKLIPLTRQALLKTMDLYNLWSSEKIDRIMRKRFYDFLKQNKE
jgi:hypothetical protein